MKYDWTEQSLKEAILRKKELSAEDYSILALLTAGTSIQQLKDYKTDLYYSVIEKL